MRSHVGIRPCVWRVVGKKVIAFAWHRLIRRLVESRLHSSLAQGRSVRSPNVSIILMCYGAFRKPRAGALGSLTECQHYLDVLWGIS